MQSLLELGLRPILLRGGATVSAFLAGLGAEAQLVQTAVAGGIAAILIGVDLAFSAARRRKEKS